MKLSHRLMNMFYGFYALAILAGLLAVALFKPSGLVWSAVILLSAGVVISILANRRRRYLSRDMLMEYIIVGLAVLIVLISAVRR